MSEATFPLPEGFTFVDELSVQEIFDVLEEPVDDESQPKWQRSLEKSSVVVGVREEPTERLVGVAMLVENGRHAELVDLNVHSNFRRLGIGSAIVSKLVEYVRQEGIDFAGLSYDPRYPWLENFYERFGYRSIPFGMMLVDSLQKLEDRPEFPSTYNTSMTTNIKDEQTGMVIPAVTIAKFHEFAQERGFSKEIATRTFNSLQRIAASLWGYKLICTDEIQIPCFVTGQEVIQDFSLNDSRRLGIRMDGITRLLELEPQMQYGSKSKEFFQAFVDTLVNPEL